jgi:phosphoglycolate phosphatase-like HAD superfamily hydrolase
MAKAARVIENGIFLDLDGVLFDTAREAYCLCVLTMDRARSLKEVNFSSRHFKIFEEHRFLINCAADYYYLMKNIDDKINRITIDVREGFERMRRLALSEACEFERNFLDKRRYVKNNHYSDWVLLNAPYVFLSKVRLLFKKEKDKFFVITTKDEETVRKLLEINGVEFLKKNIFGRKAFRKFGSKGEIIKHIKDRHNMRRSIFVDDSKEHLSSCADIKGLKLMHAGWGYVANKEKSFNQAEVVAEIKKMLGGKDVRS